MPGLIVGQPKPLVAASGYKAMALAKTGLVSYYGLDEASGNFADSGPDGIALSASGFTYHAAGALSDGSFAAQSVGGGAEASRAIGSIPIGHADRSFEFFLKSSNGAGQDVFAYGTRGSQFHYFDHGVSTNRFAISTWADDREFNSFQPIDGAWHHYAITKPTGTNDQLKVYRDGSLVGTLTYGGGSSSINTDSSTFTLFYASGAAHFDGYLDEFAIYSVELDATYIANHYAAR